MSNADRSAARTDPWPKCVALAGEGSPPPDDSPEFFEGTLADGLDSTEPRLCSCGVEFADHPHPGCSDPHAPTEFDVYGHAARVASRFPVGTIEHSVALYHDHIEDGLGPVPPAIRHHVETLTRGETEDYKLYIARVRTSGDPVAIAVKIADARDNLERCEGKHDGYVNSNLANRYRYVLRVLGAAGGVPGDET